MRQDLVREAKALAAREGITLGALVERALERETAGEQTTLDPRLSEIERDMAWYDRHREELLTRYEGQYLAIVDGEVVDHDVDAEALSGRLMQRFRDRSVYMPRCQRTPRVVNVRSPRIA